MNQSILENILVYLHWKKEQTTRPIKVKEIERYVSKQMGNLTTFQQTIRTLQQVGVLRSVKGKRVKLSDDGLIIGRFYYNPKGYGFVVSIYDKKAIYFVPGHQLGNALHEDLVYGAETLLGEDKKKNELQINGVLERAQTVVVGTYMANDNYGFVIPDNNKIAMDIYVPLEDSLGANSYDKVVCQITKQPQKNKNPEGVIKEVLGLRFERGADLLSVIKGNGLRDEFPMKMLAQLEKISGVITEDILEKRRDLREMCIVTIDGEDAKDLDDAVSIQLLSNGNYMLDVHIADVAHYVKENTKVDKEAVERGTSVYLLDTVLPMLPEKLSNDLCSLHPKSDKLTLSVSMEIDSAGTVINQSIYESVISTASRLCYGDVTAFLEGRFPEYQLKESAPVIESLLLMEKLTRVLINKRKLRGNIDFDFPEAKILLNKEGLVEEIKPYERGIGNQMIEEFMIVCNETVSEFFSKKGLPFLYRVHDKPREERIDELRLFLEKLGYHLPELETLEPIHLQTILLEAKGKKEEKAIQLLTLQTMQQARYHDLPKGHFGLATSFYSHFTSPIRRYPDLQIHRIIKSYLNKEMGEERKNSFETIVKERAKSCSRKERIAERAEDELRQIKKMEFMQHRIGERFKGMITSLSNGGVVVFLDNTVEGFLPLSALSKDAKYVKEEHLLRDDLANLEWALGDVISVELVKVKAESKEIIFSLENE